MNACRGSLHCVSQVIPEDVGPHMVQQCVIPQNMSFRFQMSLGLTDYKKLSCKQTSLPYRNSSSNHRRRSLSSHLNPHPLNLWRGALSAPRQAPLGTSTVNMRLPCTRAPAHQDEIVCLLDLGSATADDQYQQQKKLFRMQMGKQLLKISCLVLPSSAGSLKGQACAICAAGIPRNQTYAAYAAPVKISV